MEACQDKVRRFGGAVSLSLLMGRGAALLLDYLVSALEEDKAVFRQHGLCWLRKPREWVMANTGLTEWEFRSAKRRLVTLGLVMWQQLEGMGVSCWAVDHARYGRLLRLAHAYWKAASPIVDDETMPRWWDFMAENPDLIAEFGGVFPMLHEYAPPDSYVPSKLRGERDARGMSSHASDFLRLGR